MVSEVIVTITSLCDVCLHSEPSLRVDSTHTDVIKFNKRQAKQVDTCDNHYVTWVEPLLILVTEHGAVPEGQRRTRRKRAEDTPAASDRGRYPREELTCPIPGCEATARGNSGLTSHLRSTKHTDKERAALARRKKSA